MARLIVFVVISLTFAEVVIAQNHPIRRRQPHPKRQKPKPWSLANPMPSLRPEQKRLIDDFIRHYNATTGSDLVPNRPTTMLDCPSAPRSTL